MIQKNSSRYSVQNIEQILGNTASSVTPELSDLYDYQRLLQNPDIIVDPEQ